MRILFCTSTPWVRDLGGPKVVVELAEALETLGWTCDHVCLPDLVPGIRPADRLPAYAEALRRFLHEHAAGYDVVDYDHVYLPFPRSEFAATTLLVARSVLLHQQVAATRFPKRRTPRSLVGTALRGRARRRELELGVVYADRTVSEADLVNVSNTDDERLLVGRGVAVEKVVVLPYGLSQERLALFSRVPTGIPDGDPIVSFVGTFDLRKGAVDFPELLARVSAEVPAVRFRLIGTSGMFRGREDVLRLFPRRLRLRLEVIPRFSPDELPSLLAPCHVGVFPSYVEGFPFGVLEMLAAAVPVVAYHSPGPPMMLPAEYLVATGDTSSMSASVLELLVDRERLAGARRWAQQRAGDFAWIEIGRKTANAYTAALEKLRSGRRLVPRIADSPAMTMRGRAPRGS